MTETDVKSVGLTPRPAKVSPVILPAPTGIRVGFLKKSGLTRVTAIQDGMPRPCVAEISPDPLGASTFQPLAGGYSRTLTGYAAGSYWVRMATVRGSAQSDWCAPVLVQVRPTNATATPKPQAK